MLVDQCGRPLRNLRLSVTDRCNLRCEYCMPEENFAWMPQARLLTLEELADIASIFVELGVERVRLTGGEPLLRRDLHVLVRYLAELGGVKDLAMTTNGLLLHRHAKELKEAGLKRLTFSLDTLDHQRFARLTKRDRLDEVLKGIRAAQEAGFVGSKINTVVQRGFNDAELGPLLDFARDHQMEVRFIEYMDVGGATQWSMDQVVSRDQILSILSATHGAIEEVKRTDSAPADRFRLADGTVFGIISSTTQPFCATCDRSRVTADGHWFHCLYAMDGFDLRTPLRLQGKQAVRDAVSQAWPHRADRGAEKRLDMAKRGPLQDPGRNADDNPHLEMRTRGG